MESKEKDNIIRLISLSRAGLNLPYKKIVACLLIFSFSITNLTYGYERRDVDCLRRVYGPESEFVEEKVEAACDPDGNRTNEKSPPSNSKLTRWKLLNQAHESYLGKEADGIISGILNDIISKTENPAILDLMCGKKSHIPDSIKNRYLVGLDIDKEALDKNTALDERVVFDVDKWQPLPFENDRFDYVIAVSAIAYLRDPTWLFSEANRVLKPGGKFIIVFEQDDYDRAVPIRQDWLNCPKEKRANLVVKYFRENEKFGYPKTIKKYYKYLRSFGATKECYLDFVYSEKLPVPEKIVPKDIFTSEEGEGTFKFALAFGVIAVATAAIIGLFLWEPLSAAIFISSGVMIIVGIYKYSPKSFHKFAKHILTKLQRLISKDPIKKTDNGEAKSLNALGEVILPSTKEKLYFRLHQRQKDLFMLEFYNLKNIVIGYVRFTSPDPKDNCIHIKLKYIKECFRKEGYARSFSDVLYKGLQENRFGFKSEGISISRWVINPLIAHLLKSYGFSPKLPAEGDIPALEVIMGRPERADDKIPIYIQDKDKREDFEWRVKHVPDTYGIFKVADSPIAGEELSIFCDYQSPPDFEELIDEKIKSEIHFHQESTPPLSTERENPLWGPGTPAFNQPTDNDHLSFQSIDNAMERIKDIVEESRGKNPKRPILILLDGLGGAGKSELALAIDPNFSSTRYKDKYRNLGLINLYNQDIVVLYGDHLQLHYFKLENSSYSTYGDYLKNHVIRLFAKMKPRDRIIVFSEAGSRTYFRQALDSSAPEDTLVIEALLKYREIKDLREMSIRTFVWPSKPAEGGEDIKGKSLGAAYINDPVFSNNKQDLSTQFGERLKFMRENKGLSLSELAKMVDVVSSTVIAWEENKNFPKPENMEKLADVFKMSVSKLMTGMPEKELMNIRIEDRKSPEYRELQEARIKVLSYKLGLSPKEVVSKMKRIVSKDGVIRLNIDRYYVGEYFVREELTLKPFIWEEDELIFRVYWGKEEIGRLNASKKEYVRCWEKRVVSSSRIIGLGGRGRYLGKDVEKGKIVIVQPLYEKGWRPDWSSVLRVYYHGEVIASLDRLTPKFERLTSKSITRSEAQEILTKDIGALLKLKDEYLTPDLIRGKFYITVDKDWRDKYPSQYRMIEGWWKVLREIFKDYADFKDVIILNGNGENGLIKIECKVDDETDKKKGITGSGRRTIGSCSVNVEGSLDIGYRLFGLLNMVFAASCIPDIRDEGIAEYRPLLRFISKQYYELTGIKNYIDTSSYNQDTIDKKIRTINIILPPIKRKDFNEDIELEIAEEAARAV